MTQSNSNVGYVTATIDDVNTSDEDLYASVWKQRVKSAFGVLKQIIRFFLSHLSLLTIVVIYAVIGAFMFIALERPNEINLCISNYDSYVSLESSLVQRLWEVSSAYNQADDYNMVIDAFQQLLNEFKDGVLGLQQVGFASVNCTTLGQPEGQPYQWSISGALFFVATVFTTIGYGNIVPKTFWGRLVCICYAVVGIPLMLLTLANLGDAFAKLFRFLYTQVENCNKFMEITSSDGKILSAISASGAVIVFDTKRRIQTRVIYLPMETTSFYNLVCCCGGCRPTVMMSAADAGGASSTGHSRTVSVRVGSVKSSSSTKQNNVTTTSALPAKQTNAHDAWKNQFKSASSSPDDDVVLIQDEDVFVSPDENDASELVEEEEVDNEDYNEISVPLTIILGVIGGYIMLGTVLFGLWEGWDAMTAAYYCFITISTIGFGDVVPNFQSSSDQYILLGTALYMLFGMATLSMCFTLVQDQMAAKFRLLSDKFSSLIRRYLSNDGDNDGTSQRQQRADNVSSPKAAAAPAAGTEVFEMRRRQRAARLKFRWIRQQISGKNRRGGGATSGNRPKRSTSTAGSGSTAAVSSKSGLNQPLPVTNGSAHPIGASDTLSVNESGTGDKEIRGFSERASRRPATDSNASRDPKGRPLANIDEEKL